MLKLSNIRVREKIPSDGLMRVAAQILGIRLRDVLATEVLKLSIDARRKPNVFYVYTILVQAVDEKSIIAKGHPDITEYETPQQYSVPITTIKPKSTPVIVGSGPAGLFAALCLAQSGIPCIILERGRTVDRRAADVCNFWRSGLLDVSSNVQFGEGGAGTFSDGKLTTGISDMRIRFILESFVRFGAPEDILYLAKPHIGTDILRSVVVNIRTELSKLGCDFRFNHTFIKPDIKNGAIVGAFISSDSDYYIPTNHIILAIGNSARDTFKSLFDSGIVLSPKSFSVGVRIEHNQNDIDMAQYGQQKHQPFALPAADYKLAVHLSTNRTVYTFCVCPGGQVVAAASETSGVVTNGMSLYARAGSNCNGALLVTVNPSDFYDTPLGGIEFQRNLEQAAFRAGGGGYIAPAQLVSDFCCKRSSIKHGSVFPTYRPGVKFTNLWSVLPEFICAAILAALPILDSRIYGFAADDAILTAVETRSSAPIRIDRQNYQAIGINGLFPCGEGAGYAGGIMSAAVDGIKCAEALIESVTL